MSPERAVTRWPSRLRSAARRAVRGTGRGAARTDGGDTTLATVIEDARAATRRRDWVQAAERWGRVVDLGDPAPAEAYAQLARAQTQVGDPREAADSIDRGFADHPDDELLTVEHARLATVLQDWDAAAERWRHVLELTAPQPAADTFQQLAKAHQQLGDLARADTVLAEGIGSFPHDLRLRERHAQLANAARDWPEVVRRWQVVLDEAADAAPTKAYTQLARALQAQGHLDGADRILALGRTRRPQDIEIATRWAKLPAVARDWRTAVERYADLIELPGPIPPVVHRDHSRAATELGDEALAASALDVGLREHPDHPLLLVERAFLALHAAAWDDVDARWAAALSTASPPVPPELYVEMARRCAAAFEHDRAERCIADAMDHHPTDPGVAHQFVRNAISEQRLLRAPADWDWSIVLERARRVAADLRRDDAPAAAYVELATELADASAVAEACEILHEGLGSTPDDGDVRHELAELTAARGAWDEAVTHLEHLVRRSPPSPTTRSALVRAHLATGDTTAAERAVGGAAAAPDDRWRHAELARIATAAGDHSTAVEHRRRVVDLDPRSIDAHRRLAIACERAGDAHAASQVVASARADEVPLERRPGVVAIIGGGPSLAGQDLSPLRGNVWSVAVNATATALPWADVAVTHDPSHLVERFEGYTGPVVAGLPLAALRTWGRRSGFEFRRRLVTGRLSEFDHVLHSGGHTSAYTALNYAYLLGATRIVLFGIDLNALPTPSDYWHDAHDRFNRQRLEELESQPTFARWWAYRTRKLQDAPNVFATALPQLRQAGVEVLNASPDSALTCFPRVSPAEGVAACLDDGT